MRSAVPVEDLYAKLQKLPAKEIVVMVDACFSGSGGRSVIAKGTRPLVAVKKVKIPEKSKLSILSAASGAETTSR